ncbi:YceI family protein [Lysobacter sp. KIS68-7]|uniref:YceI family protein n=1 Tax=Lysobacter sp. KIS68-7 TaxID=2904252 RepID=UPI001E6492E8|nr:YceI family protein [Lysobacter sp. KIS68-7]UHQ20800.1 YceI family protein [Lysobacter sp. KIS68-7]
MNRCKLLAASLLLALGSAGAAQAAPNTYKMDPNHTIVLVSWDHFGYSHPVANFGQADGTLVYDADNVGASSVNVTLPMSGLDALVPDLTDDLRSEAFFDAAKFPNATFKSTKVEKAGEGKLKVTGDLTIRDQTKPVVLDVTLNKMGEGRNGAPKIGFSATTTIKRSEFGVVKFLPNVADEVDVRISTEATVPKAAK